ncbi:MAG: BON domain-containing protein [Planctomycetaceae bacterium]|nr:BON domain-containing protein [Planctomycetaceae bacterium]
MQRFVVSLTTLFVLVLMPAISMAENQNQKVAENIAGQLSTRFPNYSIHVKYNSGVVTLGGEVGSKDQITEAADYIKEMPGIVRVINNMKVVSDSTPIQNTASTETAGARPSTGTAPLPTAIMLPGASPVPMAKDSKMVIAATQSNAGNTENRIAQVSGQVASVADFSQRSTTDGSTANSPEMEVSETVIATPGTIPAPALPTPTPPSPSPIPPRTTRMVTPPAPLNSVPMTSNLPVAVQIQEQAAPAPEPVVINSGNNNMPMPMGQQSPTAGRYDQPNVPNYAWPSYAAPNNYAEVNYPRLYCPQAAPYIGPFYPYPQVPPGWRKVTLEWHDGYWWMDFDDGSNNGPFSPLFRSPNPKRR